MLSTVANNQWQTYNVPSWATYLNIICIGGGGGGGGGFSGAAGTARGGGGSGGSSAVTRVTVPALLVPRTLYVQVGAGGAGVSSGSGGSGVHSYVCVAPNLTPDINVLARSGGATVPSGGGTGTISAAGTAGVAGTAASLAQNALSGMGHFDAIAGQAGVLGGAHTGANGVAQSIPATSLITTSGTGGAGTTSADFAGGAWNATAGALISDYRPATPAAGSNDGSGGFALWRPLFFFGGTGGSASNTGVGGNGGNGSFGCGGGGGGAGTTGGRGGNGGNGIVIITAI